MTRVEKGREPRILVVDDEERILEAIHKLLEAEGYSVCTAGNGHEGLRLFFSWQPDLVLLDVRMPKMNGWDLLERIREMSETPVIMITVLGQENERVRGLESGADDYLPKPFGQAELVARVRAVLRRARVPSKSIEVYRDDVLTVDFLRHRVHVKDQEVGLTPLEFRVLSALVQHSRAVLTSAGV